MPELVELPPLYADSYVHIYICNYYLMDAWNMIYVPTYTDSVISTTSVNTKIAIGRISIGYHESSITIKTLSSY